MKKECDFGYCIVSTAVGIFVIASLMFSYTSDLEYQAGYAQGVLDTLKIEINISDGLEREGKNNVK